MAYKCSFLDNDIYSAQDVNDIFARITSGGVVFTDTGYTLGDLNTAQSSMVGGGVTKDTNACRVVKVGNSYKISKGVCFMNDGTTISFDEDGQEIKVTSGAINYVYLKRNKVSNTIDIVVSATAGGTDTIPLAQITQSGEIVDQRKYARAKVNLATCGDIRDFTATFSQCASNRSETITIDLGDGAFSYLIIKEGTASYNNTTYPRVACRRNMITLKEGEEVTFYIGGTEGAMDEFVHAKKSGQKIQIYFERAITSAKYVLNMGVL